jgi:hypothetical protein
VPIDEELDAVRELLERAVERLDELAYDELRSAVRGGATTRPELERRLTRARNAVLRAIGLLGAHEDGDLSLDG